VPRPRPSVMNRLSWARACLRPPCLKSLGPKPLCLTVLTAALLSGAALLLAGCSNSGASSPSGASARGPAVPAAGGAGVPNAAPAAPQAANPGSSSASGSAPATGSGSPSARLAASGASIIYTASLTVQVKSVTAAASAATRIATTDDGYVSGENASISPGSHVRPTISLQLKIPVAAYPAALDTLSSGLGTETALSQQAQDVTEQVADTSSQVASAQAAIAALRVLLARAGSVSDLLTVQDQINSEESSLEGLEAEQRALDDQTTYATVSLTLLGPRPSAPARRIPQHQPPRRGFLAGLSAGWDGLRATVSAVLTAVGAVLPFAATVAVLVAAGLAGRRRLGRLRRRRSRPSAAS
jgi:hypothetical protein